MPTTPKYAIPYPAPSDAPDVPYWMQQLATRLEAVTPQRVAMPLTSAMAARPDFAPPTWVVGLDGVVRGEGVFMFTTAQAAVGSVIVQASCIPAAVRAATDRGPLIFASVGSLGNYYGNIRHDINPATGLWTIYKPDASTMSWSGNDQRITLSGISWSLA